MNLFKRSEAINTSYLFCTIPHLADYNLLRNALFILSQEKQQKIVALIVNRGKLVKIATNELPKDIIIHPLSFWRQSTLGKVISSISSSLKCIRYILQYKPQLSIGPGYFATDLVLMLFGVPVIQFSDDVELSFTMFIENMVATEKYVPVDWPGRKKSMIYKPYLKQIAYLSPKYFTPNTEVLREYVLEAKQYIFVREVSTKSANYRNQKEYLISNIAKRFPSGYKVILSLEDKSARNLYPETWIMLEEPVSDIYSLIYYSLVLISSGDSVAREGAILGVPSIYCGIREMRVNEKLTQIGALRKLDTNEIPNVLVEICDTENPELLQINMREKVNSLFIELTDFIIDRTMHYINKNGLGHGKSKKYLS